jgi:hypothetical protein
MMLSLLKSRRAWAGFAGVGLLVVVGVGLVVLWRPTAALFHLDPGRPYRLEFGRGSGWHGLDTIKVLQDGTVTLHRQRHESDGQALHGYWETARLKLPPEALARVVDAIEEHRLLGMDKGYHGGAVDGTQWVLWVKQGEKEKSVYFDNYFPKGIIRFAEALDNVLDENGLEKVDWHHVPDVDARKHERELWDSIER